MGVDGLVADQYRDYKNEAHNHYEKYRPTSMYGTIGVDNWQKCLDLFTNPRYIVSITFILHHKIIL